MQHKMPLSAKHLRLLRWEEESPVCTEDGDSGFTVGSILLVLNFHALIFMFF